MIVYIPGFWGFEVGSGALRTDVIYRRPKHLTNIYDVIEDLALFLRRFQVRNPILVGHSFGGFLALKMVELGLARHSALLFPALPGNYNQFSWFKLRYFWKSLLGSDNKASFAEWQAWACLNDENVASEIYWSQIPEKSRIIREMAFRSPFTWISLIEVRKNLKSGIIIGSTNDKMCSLTGLASLSTELQIPLSSVTQGHYAHFESNIAALECWLLDHQQWKKTHFRSLATG